MADEFHMPIHASTETLYHYTCERCKNWWSIAIDKEGWNPSKMWCPHCGHIHYKQEINYENMQQ